MRFQCIMCFTIIRVSNKKRPDKLACPNCGNNLAVPKSRFETGCVIGDFVIESIIGRGGMATVYLARQLSMDRPVALKILEASLLKEDRYVLAFLKEAKSAARINHPNLVTSIAVGEEEGALFYAMEYVKGMTLGEKLEREKTLDCDEALNIVQQCAEALHAAWTREGLIHRDIKPDNIILAEDGYAKVMDLGIAITKQEAETADICGTPAYMAPEQFTRDSLDCRTDIYCLGCTLYTALVGYSPFEGESAHDIGRKHMHNQVVFPDRNLIMIPNRVKKLASRMMAKEPEARFQTYDDLLEEIVFIRKRLAPDESMVPSVHTISFSKYRMREEMQLSETPSAIYRKRNEKERLIAQAQRNRERENAAWPMSWYIGIIAGLTIVLAVLTAGVWYVNSSTESPYYEEVTQHLQANPLPLSDSQLSEIRSLIDEADRLLARMPRSKPAARDLLAREMLLNHRLAMQHQQRNWLLERREDSIEQLQKQLLDLRQERDNLLAAAEAARHDFENLQGKYHESLAVNAQITAADDQRQIELMMLHEEAEQLRAWEARLHAQQLAATHEIRQVLSWRIIDLVRNYQFEAARRALTTISTDALPGLAAHRDLLLRQVIDAERVYLAVFDSGTRFKGEPIGAGRLLSINGAIVKLAVTEGQIINFEDAPLSLLTASDFTSLAARGWPEDGSFHRAAFRFALLMGDFKLARQLIPPDRDLATLDAELVALFVERVNEIERYLQVGSLRNAVAVARPFIAQNQELPPYEVVAERLRNLLRGTMRPPVGSTALPRATMPPTSDTAARSDVVLPRRTPETP